MRALRISSARRAAHRAASTRAVRLHRQARVQPTASGASRHAPTAPGCRLIHHDTLVDWTCGTRNPSPYRRKAVNAVPRYRGQVLVCRPPNPEPGDRGRYSRRWCGRRPAPASAAGTPEGGRRGLGGAGDPPEGAGEAQGRQVGPDPQGVRRSPRQGVGHGHRVGQRAAVGVRLRANAGAGAGQAEALLVLVGVPGHLSARHRAWAESVRNALVRLDRLGLLTLVEPGHPVVLLPAAPALLCTGSPAPRGWLPSVPASAVCGPPSLSPVGPPRIPCASLACHRRNQRARVGPEHDHSHR